MPTETGISQGALNIIKKKVDSMSDDEKLSTLCRIYRIHIFQQLSMKHVYIHNLCTYK